MDPHPSASPLPLLKYTNTVLERGIVYVYIQILVTSGGMQKMRRDCDLRRESISFGAHVPLVLSPLVPSRPVLFLNPATYRVFKRTKR